MEGWIKLYRKLIDNPLYFAEPFTRMQAWIDLLMIANHEENFYYLRGNKVVVGRGQIGMSSRTLAGRWKWSRSKVERFLNDLKDAHQIIPQKSHLITLISICNYEIYQGDQPQTVPQTVPQKSPNKNDKNEKNIYITQKDTNVSLKVDEKKIDADKSKSKFDWKNSFDVYRSELKVAYDSLITDVAFISEREKYNPKIDIKLTLEKAYTEYWNTEIGWKKKKSSRSNSIDWKRTFINAISVSGNKVYNQNKPYTPVTDTQKKFAAYLDKHAPLMRNMPIQPTDEEISELRDIPNATLESVLTEINNNRYLTSGRNSIYQTIREILQKRIDTG